MSRDRVGNSFYDPATNYTYDWPINHDEEEPFTKSRNIDATANTGNTGLVRQQGAEEPLTIRIKGTILTDEHLRAFWAWFKLCRTQTVIYTDFTGDSYEVQITSFAPKKLRAAANPRGGEINPMWYWKYDMSMEVFRFIGDNAMGGIVP